MSGPEPSDIRLAKRVLVVLLVLGTAIAVAGSALFWSGKFDHFPYGWF